MAATHPEPEAEARPLPGGLHGHPPLTPAGVLLKFRLVIPVLGGVFVTLAILAALNDGAPLRTWDAPIQRWVRDQRNGILDPVFRTVSQLGGLNVVVIGLATLLLLLYRRCHSLAYVLLTAVLARPALEWVLKAAIDRPRPDIDRLVPGMGASFPSGHVMAAIALWGLVPPVVALLTRRRFWWWVSVAGSGLIILGVAFSRMYLGVHWFSDVVGALVLGSLYLLGVEYLLGWHHDRRGCVPLDEAERDLLRPAARGP